jgi:hypothetical protein
LTHLLLQDAVQPIMQYEYALGWAAMHMEYGP